MITWIKDGELVDPRSGTKKKLDVVIKKGKIESIIPPGEYNPPNSRDVETIDSSGMIITPGLIDMHVHFREPGEEYKET
ncbi:MAG TPA: dihydroorotase, partial [Desulfobacteraceae bacterium]|nr:dihydroorotase [Desulfobacteraceae bacterium]